MNIVRFFILFSVMAFSISSSANISNDLKARLKNFRDPFKTKYGKGKRASTKKTIKTKFSNQFDVSTIFIEDIKVIGIYLGKERRAIGVQQKSSSAASEPFIIKEGCVSKSCMVNTLRPRYFWRENSDDSFKRKFLK